MRRNFGVCMHKKTGLSLRIVLHLCVGHRLTDHNDEILGLFPECIFVLNFQY